MPTPTDLTIVIAVYRGGEPFRACLASLQALTPPPHEVIIVSDGDADSTAQARAHGFTVYEIAHTGNAGAVRNVGVQHVTTPLIFFTDADVSLPSDTVQRVVDFFTAHPDYAALMGSYDDSPADAHFLSQYRNLLHHYTHQHAQTEAFTFWTACGAITRAAFLSVGGFKGKFRGIEDIELGYRLRLAGYRIYLDKTLQVKHHKRWTVQNLLYTDTIMRAMTWTQLLTRYGDSARDLNLDRRNRFSVAGVGMAGLLAVFGVLYPPLWLLSVGALVGVAWLNWAFYAYLARLRGWPFALWAIVWHDVYFVCAGVGFVLGKLNPT